MENIWQTVKDIAAILGDIGSALSEYQPSS
mgnify:CR=1 FL=1